MKSVFFVAAVLVLFFLPRAAFAAPGDLGTACRDTTPQCNTGFECNNGICTTPCGGTNQQCCQTADPQRLCDVHLIEFQNLICSNPASPSAGLCQVKSCGALGENCCSHGVACQNNGVCTNSLCVQPTGTNTPTNTPDQTASHAGQIIVSPDPNAKAFFNPNFTSLIIQSMFFVLTLAVIFSVVH